MNWLCGMVYKGGATIVVMGMMGVFGALGRGIGRVWSGVGALYGVGVVCGSVWKRVSGDGW